MKNNLFSTRNFIVLIVFIIIAVGSMFLLATNSNLNQNEPSLKPDHKLLYFGSIGIGTDKVGPGVTSFKKNYNKLDELTLYWYNLDSNETIARDSSVSEEAENETLAFAKKNKVKVLVGISDHGEAEKADDILDNEDIQKTHISKIISLLDEKGYDGVIIDYEDLREDQEEDFTRYMSKLSEQVRSKGKALGISIPVETAGQVFHGINIVDVSKVVDKMHMNVYEEYGSETEPGPIASIGWVNIILKNAVVQGVDPSKIVLGTAHSGHDWITSPSERFFKDATTKDALKISTDSNVDLKWNKETQSSFFEYKDADSKKHVVWLEDYRSFKAKTDLAKSYELQGMFIWYLGGEDPQIWQDL